MDGIATETGITRILVVEDTPEDFELIKRELLEGGLSFSATRVDTHEELVRALRGEPPSIVLCDHGNARLDSLGVLDLVRGRYAEVPFVVVTGSLDNRLINTVLERGADDYVLKRDMAGLVPAVRRALRLGGLRLMLSAAAAERERLLAELEDWGKGRPRPRAIVPICASCKKIREPDGRWLQLEFYFNERFDIRFSHGLCAQCLEKYLVGE